MKNYLKVLNLFLVCLLVSISFWGCNDDKICGKWVVNQYYWTDNEGQEYTYSIEDADALIENTSSDLDIKSQMENLIILMNNTYKNVYMLIKNNGTIENYSNGELSGTSDWERNGDEITISNEYSTFIMKNINDTLINEQLYNEVLFRITFTKQ